MKRFTRFICFFLILATVLAVPVSAAENATPRGSDYFGSFLAYLYKTSSTSFEAWIEVSAVKTMDELGASSILIQRSSDNENWTDMYTYKKDLYPNLIGEDTGWHDAHVTYSGSTGYYYRAKVWFYAKKDSGTAYYSYTTDSIQL